MTSGDITTDKNEIQKIVRGYFESLYSKKLENLEEMDKFLDSHDPSSINTGQKTLTRSVMIEAGTEKMTE